MSILFVLVPMAAILAGLAVGAFVWSVRRGQLDDLETPALRVLSDEVPMTLTAGPPERASGGRRA